MRKKTCIGILFAALLTGSMLAGCADSANGGTETAASTQASEETLESSQEDSVTEEAQSQQAAAEEATDAEPSELLIAAAASLEYSFEDELIPMFEEMYPSVSVEGTYDSSGKLQTQIEEGIGADVFMSAATKQMNALVDESLVNEDSVVNLLENKIVLITAADSTLDLKEFTDITKAETIAIGDPASVPVGQYSEEALTNLGIWDEVLAKASLGTNVTEVLNWVAEGSADAGIVYATDAATTDKVKVIAEAPADSLAEPAIYPVGVISDSQNKEMAEKFVEFLQSEEALAVFEKYGFMEYQNQ